MTPTQLDRLAEELAVIAVMAAAPIMAIYAAGAVAARKTDGSPVTAADLAAQEVIMTGLAALLPGVPVLAEESAAEAAFAAADVFVLVDPLDGTKEFLAGNGEFTVNIGLIEAGAPVCGAVYAPALESLWLGASGAEKLAVAAGCRLDQAGERGPIRVRPWPPSGLVAAASRSHGDGETEAFLAALPIIDRRGAGSSLKFCLIAEGAVDLYPRFGPTMEWDTAAGHAVLNAAGGALTCLDGQAFRYGKEAANYRNGPFVAWGEADPAVRQAYLAEARR